MRIYRTVICKNTVKTEVKNLAGLIRKKACGTIGQDFIRGRRNGSVRNTILRIEITASQIRGRETWETIIL
jgi:hypothetical protein